MGLLLSGLVLLAGAMTTAGNLAFAQEAAATCSPAVGRIVALQGNVEVQRAGSTVWVPIRRLDTAICAGDRLRTDALSRSLLFIQPESFVRVDQNTMLTISQTTDEIEVQFFASELAEALRSTHSSGAGYFITRFPKKFKVTTPHMNAAVEGTEFMVETSGDATKLTVIEGEVSSESVATRDAQLVTAGQSLESGATGPAAITAVVKPLDTVQWVLRYPPISDRSNATKAEALLRAGSVEEAIAEIDSVLRSEPGSSDAHALRTIIQVAKSDRIGALESAGRATAVNEGNYRAWLALSYAQQAAFNLKAALDSAVKAEALQSSSALAHARVAELHLSLGDSKRAEKTAREAIASDPAESHAHSMLGFVHLAQIEIASARVEFASAIERDSFSALPRLGLGLAMIRDGELVAGREQIEIAVALDPINSLLRSYVGKAYYEENSEARNALASEQFELAKTYDPRDPTPWLYDAIRLQTTNRPIEAVDAYQGSIARNDNRAIYRSGLLLAEDDATRGVSLARAYHEVGFDQLAIRESAVSVNADPDNSSAHRFLADSYVNVPRHEIARQSELLQSQLLQPLNATPIPPQLTEDNLFILRGAGPAVTGLNEYTPLFTQNGLAMQADVLAGNLDTWSDQVIVAGLNDRVAFAFSQFAYSTGGFRDNDDFDKLVLDGFVQFQPTVDRSFQAEVRHSTSEFGDLLLSFDPDLFFPLRNNLDDTRVRLGMREGLGPGTDMIVSATAIDNRETIDDSGIRALEIDTRLYIAEVQFQHQRERFNVITGAGYNTEKQDQVSFGFPFEFRPYAANAYAYLNFSPFAVPFTVHLGASVDHLADKDDITRSRTKVNPKLGITFSPRQGTTVRAAAFRVLKRQFATSQTLEPSQVAGFNQFYDDQSATEASRSAIAIDHRLAKNVHAGVELGRRDLTVPFDFTGEKFHWDERNGQFYLYWAPTPKVAVTAAYRVEEFSRPLDFPGKELITDVETRTVPLGVSVYSPKMFFGRIVSTYVDQSGSFFTSSGSPVPVPGESKFWVTDISLGYRLSRRRGTVSLEIRNVFDREFRFQETDLFARALAREQLVLGRFTLVF